MFHMLRPPIIGITSGPDVEEAAYGSVHRYRLSSDYTKAVQAAGGIPLILPLHTSSIPRLLGVVDGLVFSGGADLDPSHFGDKDVHPDTYGLDDERDSFELDLMRAAVAADKPVLSICRGIQVLNVAFGGTLYQHIADQVEDPLPHRQQLVGVPGRQGSHDVQLTPDSITAKIFGMSTIRVNSLHHQSIRDIGEGLAIDGVSLDGVIEAVSRPESSFVVGVQWHPEMMQAEDPLQRKPFDALMLAATARVAVPV